MYINKGIYTYIPIPEPETPKPEPRIPNPDWCSRVLANNCSVYFFASVKNSRIYD